MKYKIQQKFEMNVIVMNDLLGIVQKLSALKLTQAQEMLSLKKLSNGCMRIDSLNMILLKSFEVMVT
jgi:hypothetical protein